jgi:valyl-tRNA synthetase
MLSNLAALVDDATEALADYDYARALHRTESFFWDFCDNYVELVKGRRYGVQGVEAASSANSALQTALDVLVRLLAPYLPYATEEVWSWWRDGSVHRASWPAAEAVLAAIGGVADEEAQGSYLMAVQLSAEVRRLKSAAQRSQKTPVRLLRWQVPDQDAARLNAVQGDVMAALHIERMEIGIGDPAAVEIDLQPPDEAQA